MASIGSVFRMVTEIIFRSIFAGSDNRFKHAPIPLTIALTASQVMLAGGRPYQLATALSTVLVIHALASTINTYLYSLLITSLPALWYFLTTLPFTASPLTSAIIALRVVAVGTATLTFIYFLNPVEISLWISKLGRGWGIYPSLTWKAIPHVMRDMQSALLSTELKGESFWRAVAVTALAVSEYSDFYEEGLYTKIFSFRPRYWYDKLSTITYSAILAVCVTALVTPYMI